MEGSSLSLGLALTSVMLSGKGCCGCSAASSSFRLASKGGLAFHHHCLTADSSRPHPTPHLSLPRTAISTLNFRQPAWLARWLARWLSVYLIVCLVCRLLRSH